MSTTTTRTRTRMDNDTQQGGQVAVLHPPRLPHHPLIEERFGVDKAAWKALVEAIYPAAKTTDAIAMALSYCKARNLDPFKRMVHIVPMWSTATNGYVETVWPGIAEVRTTAFRTGQYAGKDETEFGPMVERKFEGRLRNEDRAVVVTFPEWGRVRIKRVLDNQERVFVSPKVYWLETYGRWGNTLVPNDMWAKRPIGQFEKCVEAAGLRCAFPEEIGSDYTADEMEGRTIENLGEAQQRAVETKPSLTNALDQLAGGAPPSTPATEADVIELRPADQGPDHGEPAASATVEDDGGIPESLRRDANNNIKRPERIDLELGLKDTIDAGGILAFIRQNQPRIDKLGKEDRRLWDRAVEQHQDALKQRETD